MLPWKRKPPPRWTKDQIREKCRILILDDDDEFDIAEILRKAGWSVEQERDIDSLEDGCLREANIVFVDIRGVGKAMRFTKEGLGLAEAIKRHHPDKMVAVYSAEREGDRFDSAWEWIDERIHKDVDPYRFQDLVERLAEQCFTYEKCIDRIQKYLSSELGISLDRSKISSHMRKCINGSEMDISRVAKLTPAAIEKVGAIASIVSVCLR